MGEAKGKKGRGAGSTAKTGAKSRDKAPETARDKSQDKSRDKVGQQPDVVNRAPRDRRKPTGRRKIREVAARHRERGETIVFTNGVFDILHRGHVEYLAAAKALGDVLIVGLNSDESTRRLKGPSRPVQSQEDRAVVLLALRSVDYVVVFGEDTPYELIGEVRPDVLVKGADYKPREVVGWDIVKSYGGSVRRVRLTRGRSTTGVLKKLGE